MMTRPASCRVLRAVTVLLVLVAGASWPLHASPLSAQDADDQTALDLAAMTLTPGDLEDEGLGRYGLGYGTVSFLAEEIAFYTDVVGVDNEEVENALTNAEFVRNYESGLLLSPDDDPTALSARSVASYVVEFADRAGAADGWDFFQEEADIGIGDLRSVKPFGDESEATLVRGNHEVTGEEFQALDVTVRLGRLHAGVRITDWRGGEPEVAEAEALTERLLERIERVLDDGAPGLSNQIIRLTGNDVVLFADFYTLLDGRAHPAYGDSIETTRQRLFTASRLNAIDVYLIEANITAGGEGADVDLTYSVELWRLTDETTMRNWLDDQAEEQRIPEGFGPFRNVVIDEDAATFGDQSITFSGTHQELSGRYHGVVLRVERVVVWITLSGPETPPQALIEDLAAAQVECLEEGGCPEPVHLSGD